MNQGAARTCKNLLFIDVYRSRMNIFACWEVPPCMVSIDFIQKMSLLA